VRRLPAAAPDRPIVFIAMGKELLLLLGAP